METESAPARAGALVDAPGLSYDPAASRETPSPDLGKDEFLQLLVAQLKYQDPLNPSSSEEFIATTAQFTVVEKLDELTKQGENSALVNSLTTASSLIGREVTANVNGVHVTAVIDQSQIVSGKVELLTKLGPIGLDQIVSVGAPPAPEPTVPAAPVVAAPAAVTETPETTPDASDTSPEPDAVEPVQAGEAIADAPDGTEVPDSEADVALVADAEPSDAAVVEVAVDEVPVDDVAEEETAEVEAEVVVVPGADAGVPTDATANITVDAVPGAEVSAEAEPAALPEAEVVRQPEVQPTVNATPSISDTDEVSPEPVAAEGAAVENVDIQTDESLGDQAPAIAVDVPVDAPIEEPVNVSVPVGPSPEPAIPEVQVPEVAVPEVVDREVVDPAVEAPDPVAEPGSSASVEATPVAESTDPVVATAAAGQQFEVPPATELVEPPVDDDWDSTGPFPTLAPEPTSSEGSFDPFEQLS